METIRRTFKNQVEEDLKIVRTTIRQNEEAVYRLTYEKQPFRTVEMIEKANIKIRVNKEKETELIQKISDIEAGLYDKLFTDQMKRNTEEAKAKAAKKTKKNKTGSPSNLITGVQKTKKQIKVEMKQEYEERRKVPTERDMAIDYDRFLRSCGKLPVKLQEKVQKLPNNHGVLFNGIWFMGEMPEKRPYDTIVIQEKSGEDFLVHYYTNEEHTVFKKIGYGRNQKEVIVKKESRRRVFF